MKSHYDIISVMKNDTQLYAVGYLCRLCTGVRFFGTLEQAENYINFEKSSLQPLGIELQRDFDFFYVNSDHKMLVESVCTDDGVAIHSESGLTYSKTIFKTEQDFVIYMHSLNRK